MLSDQVRRLALFAVIGGGLWTFGLVMDLVLLRIADTTFVQTPMVTVIEILGIVAGDRHVRSTCGTSATRRRRRWTWRSATCC